MVLRSGVPDTVPGRSMNVCERGIAAVLAGELVDGEVVGVEVRLPQVADPLRARAMVRHQDKLRCGLEFLGLTTEQRADIREWTKVAKAESESGLNSSALLDSPPVATDSARARTDAGADDGSGSDGTPPAGPRKKRGMAWPLLLLGAAIAVAIFWWKWNRSWQELEAGLKMQKMASAETPQAQVPAEVMQKLLIHRVEPAYPVEARKDNLQAIIALDIVVGRDGSVVNMHPLNGPDILAQAAMDALRWWKFEPYRMNGEPAVVETTVAVEFK